MLSTIIIEARPMIIVVVVLIEKPAPVEVFSPSSTGVVSVTLVWSSSGIGV
jgi:hypothetical protein